MTQNYINTYLQNINNDHVILTMRKLDRDKILLRSKSDEYDVIDPDTGKSYPQQGIHFQKTSSKILAEEVNNFNLLNKKDS
jgi:hypothetical protein